jgi:hypothetical protein
MDNYYNSSDFAAFFKIMDPMWLEHYASTEKNVPPTVKKQHTVKRGGNFAT